MVALPWWRARRPSKVCHWRWTSEKVAWISSESRAPSSAEVGGPLARHLVGAGAQALEQVGREQAALDGDRDVRHQPVLPVGTSTKQPMTSGGSWAWISSRGALVRLRRRACASASAATRCSITGRYQRAGGVEEVERPGQMLGLLGLRHVGGRLGAIGELPSRPVDRLQPAQLAVLAPAGGEHDLLGEALDRLGAAGLLAQQVADAQQQEDRAPVDGIGEDRAGAREAGARLGREGAAQHLVGHRGDQRMRAADRLGLGIEPGIEGDLGAGSRGRSDP